MTSVFAEFRALDRRIWSLAVARLVVTAGFSMVLPFLAIHLTVERHFPATVAGLIWTVAGACGAATQWAAGEIADRVGRRPLLITSLSLRVVNLALLGWAVAERASPVPIGALIVANAVLRAFFDPVCNAAVADLVPPDQRVAAYSLQRIGINVGWAAGPALLAFASARGLSYATMFLASAPLTLLATLGVVAIRDLPCLVPERRARPRLGDLLAYRHDRAFMRVLVATLAFFVLQAQLYQTLSIYAARSLGLSKAAVGMLYTVNGLIVVALQLPAVTWIRRIGTRGALVWGSLGYAAAYGSVGLALGTKSVIACVVAVTLSEIVVAPAQQSTIAALAPVGKMGAYAGLFGLTQSIGQSAGPLIGTAALDVMPARAAWGLLAFFGIAAAVAYRPSAAQKSQQGSGFEKRSVM